MNTITNKSDALDQLVLVIEELRTMWETLSKILPILDEYDTTINEALINIEGIIDYLDDDLYVIREDKCLE